MNNDLIRRAELLKSLDAFGSKEKSNDFLRGIEITRKIIEEQPAVDEDDLK